MAELHFQSWWAARHGCATAHSQVKSSPSLLSLPFSCVVSSGHCSEGKSCQTSLKWLFSLHGAHAMCSVEPSHSPAQGFTDITHQPLFHTPADSFHMWREGHTITPPLTPAPWSACGDISLPYSWPRPLLKIVKQAILFHGNHFGTNDLYLNACGSSIRLSAGLQHRTPKHITLPCVIFPKCQLFSA